MGIPKGIAAGVVAGLLGAAAWAAIAYYANLEIGYLAWGIGAAVGIAAAAAAGETGPMLGVAAVLITIASICGGKYAAIELSLQNELAQGLAESEIDPEDFEEPALISHLAQGIAEELEANGQEVDWPEFDEGADLEQVDAKDFFPPEIWQSAVDKWEAMDDSGRQNLRVEVSEQARMAMQAFGRAMADGVRDQAFFESFTAIDLVFFGLGVFTAWGIAGRNDDESADQQEVATA